MLLGISGYVVPTILLLVLAGFLVAVLYIVLKGVSHTSRYRAVARWATQFRLVCFLMRARSPFRCLFHHEVPASATIVFTGFILVMIAMIIWAVACMPGVADILRTPVGIAAAILSVTSAIGLIVTLRIHQALESRISTARSFLTSFRKDLDRIENQHHSTKPSHLRILCYAPILGLITLEGDSDQEELYFEGFRRKIEGLVGHWRKLNLAIVCLDKKGVDALVRRSGGTVAGPNNHRDNTEKWLDHIDKAPGGKTAKDNILTTRSIVWRVRSVSPTHLYILDELEVVYRYTIRSRVANAGNEINGARHSQDATELANADLQFSFYGRKVAQAVKVVDWNLIDVTGHQQVQFELVFDHYQKGLARVRIFLGEIGDDKGSEEVSPIGMAVCDIDPANIQAGQNFILKGKIDVTVLTCGGSDVKSNWSRIDFMEFDFIKVGDDVNTPVTPSETSWPLIRMDGHSWDLVLDHPCDLRHRGRRTWAQPLQCSNVEILAR